MIGYLILTAAMILLLGHALIHRGGEMKVPHIGLNYYPWAERKQSLGFKLRYTNNRVLAVRWSVLRKRLNIWHTAFNKRENKWEHSSYL